MNLIIGLDMGKKTGIAKAFGEIKIAFPYKTVFSFKDLVEEINLLKPSVLVVGWPVLLRGVEGLQCRRVKSWVNNLISQTYQMPVYYENEAFSTQEVRGALDEDAASAAWILQKFLDSH